MPLFPTPPFRLLPPPISPAAAGKEGKQFGVPMEAEGFVTHMRALLEDVQVSGRGGRGWWQGGGGRGEGRGGEGVMLRAL